MQVQAQMLAGATRVNEGEGNQRRVGSKRETRKEREEVVMVRPISRKQGGRRAKVKSSSSGSEPRRESPHYREVASRPSHLAF
jgi:hypothetical protein